MFTISLIFLLFLQPNQQPTKWGDNWKEFPELTKAMYVKGFIDGENFALTSFSLAAFQSENFKNKEIFEYTKKTIESIPQPKTNVYMIKDAISDLYRNKENSNIPYDKMFVIAIKDLQGLDITNDLIQARQAAIK